MRGFLLLASGVPLLTYGLAEIGATGQFADAARARPVDRSGSSLIGVFVVHALRARVPLLDLRLYRRATFASASVAMFCLGAALFGGMILIPLYWQQVRGRERPRHGPPDWRRWASGWSSIMPLVGRLADRHGGGPIALDRRRS